MRQNYLLEPRRTSKFEGNVTSYTFALQDNTLIIYMILAATILSLLSYKILCIQGRMMSMGWIRFICLWINALFGL